MKTKNQFALLTFIFSMFSSFSFAFEFEVDGIKYDVIPKGKVASVISAKNCTGDLVIPEYIKYDGIDCVVNKIEDEAFLGCKLTSIVVPKSVTYIGSDAFSYSYSLTTVELPDDITDINYQTFYNCSSLKTVKLPSQLTRIASFAFSGCRALSSISIPDKVNYIGEQAFSSCESLFSVTIPESVNTIGKSAFSLCSSLQSVAMPNSIERIEESTFSGCSSLLSVEIPNSVKFIGGGVFYGCTSLESAIISNQITGIGTRAFSKCTSLSSIEIPGSVSEIGDYAFSECSLLATVKIPASVTSIGKCAFSECENLTDFYCHPVEIPYTGTLVFTSSHIEYANLYVPSASLEKYKNKYPWNEFGSITGLEGEMPDLPQCASPIICFNEGNITFISETDGAEFVYSITDEDVATDVISKGLVELNASINISVYAVAEGYLQSDPSFATLHWIEKESVPVSIEDIQLNRRPILVSASNGSITISGLNAEEIVEFYTIDGKLIDQVKAHGNQACFNIQIEGVIIIRIGKQNFKVSLR